MRDMIGHFSIYGDLHAADITAALGLEPSCTTPKGTWYEGADFASKVEEWELYCPENLTMGEQIAYLLGGLWLRSDAVRTLALLHHADFNISGEGSEVLQLTPEQIGKIAQLNVHLNLFFHEHEDAA